MGDLAYARTLRKLAGFFDSEKRGRVLFSRNDYSLTPLRDYLAGLDALRTAPCVLHVGGTNGKGSISAYAGAIFRELGLTVGLFTSPHLVSYRERIQLNGRPVSKELFHQTVEGILAEKPDPGGSPMRSVFEILTAAAAIIFKETALDVAIFEVGLGGKLDATNVLETDVSVLGPIALDHTEVLGGTLEEIAADKAGIIRAGHPVIAARQAPEVLGILEREAEQRDCGLLVEGRDFRVTSQEGSISIRLGDGLGYEGLQPGMPGPHQASNAAVALEACRALLGDLDEAAVRRGVRRTRLAGRLQRIGLCGGSAVWVDGGHNPAAARAVARGVPGLAPGPRALLLGVSANKDAPGILAPLLPLFDAIFVTGFPGPRSLPPGELGALVRGMSRCPVEVCPGVEAAWRSWWAVRDRYPTLLCFGSLFLAGALLSLLHGAGLVDLDPEPDPVVG